MDYELLSNCFERLTPVYGCAARQTEEQTKEIGEVMGEIVDTIRERTNATRELTELIRRHGFGSVR